MYQLQGAVTVTGQRIPL